MHQRLGKSVDSTLVPFGARLRLLIAICAMIGLSNFKLVAEEPSARLGQLSDMITNTLQMRQILSSGESLDCFVRLEGVVLWVSPAHDQLILQDDSGACTVRMDLGNQSSLIGEHLIIEGTCMVRQGSISSEPIVNNDGMHASIEKSGTVFLRAGFHPICVEWFNAGELFDLAVDWSNPWQPRVRVPGSALWRSEKIMPGLTDRLEQGLNYCCYEGDWSRLPDFSQLPVLQRGVVNDFDLLVRTRDTNVGIVYIGFLSVQREGEYTFWTKSDDGSKLFIDSLPLQIHKLGKVPLPSPRLFTSDQPIGEENEGQSVEVEGVVTRISEVLGGVCLELTSGAGIKYLKILDTQNGDLELFLHSRIRCVGIYEGASTPDGKVMPTLLVPNIEQITILEVAPAHWHDYPVSPIGDLVGGNNSNGAGSIVHISGTIRSNSLTKVIVVEDKTGLIVVQPTQIVPQSGDLVEGLGWRKKVGSNVIVRGGFYREKAQTTTEDPETLPLLPQVEQIKRLNREEAERGYPVRVQGVVTAESDGNFFIQGSDQAIYVVWKGVALREPPRIGEYWEVDGKSDFELAPIIAATHAVYLRPGILPEPVRPQNNDLVNGTLNSKYIEIRGVVTDVDGNEIALLTHAGVCKVKCNGMEAQEFNGLGGALIRVEGVVGSESMSIDQGNEPDLILFSSSFNVEQPPPSNPFDIPSMSLSELLGLDANTESLKRIRVTGQIVGRSNNEYFLMHAGLGIRFRANAIDNVSVGDYVNVVGFPSLIESSQTLLESIVRRVGRGPLPVPSRFNEDVPLNSRLDATLVQVKSHLIGVSEDSDGNILELQMGVRRYLARLKTSDGTFPHLIPGSLLQLTGVYVGQREGGTPGNTITSFELLLNSPVDIQVLELPSWWTGPHVLDALGGMTLAISLALIWVAILRRQVEQRSQQLAKEIERRKQTDHQRLLELERTRIAQDLHDDLGAQVTQISLLSSMSSGNPILPKSAQTHLDRIFNISQELLSALYATVWTVNPENDNLYALGNYIKQMADGLCEPAKLRYRLQVQNLPRDILVSSHTRHNVIMAAKESLHNVIKHSKATEVTIRVTFRDSALTIVIQDNGCGFEPDTTPGGSGLENMKRRLDAINGDCLIQSKVGEGTLICLRMPVQS